MFKKITKVFIMIENVPIRTRAGEIFMAVSTKICFNLNMCQR